MAVVIRQEIYEDLKLQSWVSGLVWGIAAPDAFPACWGNSEGRWEGFAAGPECWKREVGEGIHYYLLRNECLILNVGFRGVYDRNAGVAWGKRVGAL